MLDSSRVINGSYGQVFDENGTWLTNIFKFSADVELNLQEIKRAGDRWTQHKLVSLKGSGSIEGYLVTSELIEKIGRVGDTRGKMFTGELIAKLEDPESYGAYRVRLKNVMFDKIPLIQFDVGEIVNQELSFVFAGYQFLDTIKSN